MKAYNFCQNCGSKLEDSKLPLRCEQCDSVYYDNPLPTVGVFPVKGGKVLLAKRAHEPKQGTLDSIGGFIEAGETAEEAAIRETKEETGLDVELTQFLGTQIDTYGDANTHTLSLNYVAEVTGGVMKAQDDVAELVWVDITDEQITAGFESVNRALQLLRQQHGQRS